jgi:hypothetical protein
MESIRLSNRKKAYLLTILVVVFLVIIMFLPAILIYYFENSQISKNLTKFSGLPYLIVFCLFYFIKTGVYYYKMKFESSTFSVLSKRTISGYFGGKHHTIEITNEMLCGYQFFDNIYSFNCQLLLQIKKANGRRRAIRIPLSLVSKKGKKQLSDILSNIIEDNNK